MNDSNPFQAPSSIPQNKQDDQKVRRVATAQRMVLLALLANIGVNVASYVIGGQSVVVQVVFLAAALAVVGFVIFAMYNLAKELNSQGLAIFYAILMIVPCVSLIMLLVVNRVLSAVVQFLKILVLTSELDQRRRSAGDGVKRLLRRVDFRDSSRASIGQAGLRFSLR